jgi:hypothetical protein
LAIVAVCVALTWPTVVAAKVNESGPMLSAAGVSPVPFKLTVLVIAAFPAPGVELEAVRNAWRPPASVGVKLTSTEQL